MRVLLAFLVCLAISATSDAQVRADLIEVGGTGSLTFTDGNGRLILSPVLGYFVSDRIEVGFNPTLTSGLGDNSVFLTAFGAFHFASGPDARTVPYVAANLGASLSDGGGIALGAQGGIKHFVAPGGAITLAAVVNTNDDFDPIQLGLQAGVSVFFGR